MLTSPTYSVVVPVYNEEAVLPLLFVRLDALLVSLDGPGEVILVDDGSRDGSARLIEEKARSDARYRFVGLSRNFGHQVAITSGLDLARGAATVVLDADLQDPPELVHDLIAKWREGYEVVCAQRVSRDGEGRFKRLTADLFYRGLSRLASVEIPRNVGDCRLMDRRVLDAFKAMPERERFVRGMVAWIGFRQALVPYSRAARAAGTTKYPLSRMLRLAANALVSFSEVPLRVSLWCGMAVSALALLYGCGAFVVGLTRYDAVPGWSSLMVMSTFLGGLNMMMTGVMGLYVGRIYTEVKGRPLYIVDRTAGFAPAADQAADPRQQLEVLRREFGEPDRLAS